MTTPSSDDITAALAGAEEMEHTRSAMIAAQAYQVIGALLDQCGMFDAPEGIRALDYFAWEAADAPREDFLPWSMPEPLGWQDIATAPKDGTDIVCLSPTYHDGHMPIVLRWYKYNGLAAYRDWDADPHQPTFWHTLPPLPLPPSQP